jgi:acetyl-CoA acetyltransferase
MSDLRALKDRVAVVGVGNTRYGSFPETDDYGLGAQAFRAALADSGLDKRQIDGLLVCRLPYYA